MSLTHYADLNHEGLYRRRISDSPREKAIAEQWEKENADGVSFGAHWGGQRVPLIVALLMGDEGSPDVTQRDATVAATVLQWLGSNVGFCFLQDAFRKAGYDVRYTRGVL